MLADIKEIESARETQSRDKVEHRYDVILVKSQISILKLEQVKDSKISEAANHRFLNKNFTIRN